MAGFTYKRKDWSKDKNVTTAQSNLDANTALKPTDWTGGTYGEAMNTALDNFNNRGKFSYNLNGDMLYNQYKNQYLTAGKQAMTDATGQAAALTGGYGNSYAATVGNQAYQSYVQQLNNKVPELYQLAYNKYNQEGQDMLNKYNTYKNLYDTEYGQYRDRYADWENEQARLQGIYDTAVSVARSEADTDYNNAWAAYQQKVSEDQWKQSFDESVNQWKKEFGEKVKQNKISNEQWEKEFNKSVEQWEKQFKETQKQNGISNEQWEKQFNESVEQWKKEFKAQYSGGTATANTGASTTKKSGSSSGKGSKSTKKTTKNVINTSGGTLTRPKSGKLEDNNVSVIKNKNGTTTYIDEKTGKKTTMPTNRNPFVAGTKNAVNKDTLTNGKFDETKVFSNGYQPNNVKGDKLKSYDTLNSGDFKGQKVWQTKKSGKYYVWNEKENKYIQMKKSKNGWVAT